MGISGKLILGGLFASIVAAGLPGCQEKQGFGFVQIKTQIKLATNDVYMLNDKRVTGLKLGADLVLKQKTGPAKLSLLRNGRVWSLCSFNLAANRVVTATLTPVNGTIRCVVQG
ncbi:MAG: hypothetical protein KDJ29_19745 [Hyphomicrobiales bacterium]|nr:hypothetical protein [Hyphomicrobiales bacterium]